MKKHYTWLIFGLVSGSIFTASLMYRFAPRVEMEEYRAKKGGCGESTVRDWVTYATRYAA